MEDAAREGARDRQGEFLRGFSATRGGLLVPPSPTPNKFVMFNDVGRKYCNWHLYVLISIQWCLEVHVLDVGTGKAGTFGADDNIP